MDTFSIREYRAIADAATLHDRFISMTLAARLSDRGPVYGRVWSAGGQHCGEVAILCMAIAASCCFGSIVNSLSVETAIVVRVSTRVKL
jgi:hypothetical protein